MRLKEVIRDNQGVINAGCSADNSGYRSRLPLCGMNVPPLPCLAAGIAEVPVRDDLALHDSSSILGFSTLLFCPTRYSGVSLK